MHANGSNLHRATRGRPKLGKGVNPNIVLFWTDSAESEGAKVQSRRARFESNIRERFTMSSVAVAGRHFLRDTDNIRVDPLHQLGKDRGALADMDGGTLFPPPILGNWIAPRVISSSAMPIN